MSAEFGSHRGLLSHPTGSASVVAGKSSEAEVVSKSRAALEPPIPPVAGGLPRDPLKAVVVSVTPILLESRYRLLVSAYVRLRRSRRGRWAVGAGSGAVTLALAALAARHFAAMSWPLSGRHLGVLVAAAWLLVLAQALKAVGWGRLFTPSERPPLLALAAGNGGAALVGILPYGTFRYRVTRHRIVPATDVAVLRTREREQLILQSCHPRFFATHRYLVYALPLRSNGR
jgi:sortase family protein